MAGLAFPASGVRRNRRPPSTPPRPFPSPRRSLPTPSCTPPSPPAPASPLPQARGRPSSRSGSRRIRAGARRQSFAERRRTGGSRSRPPKPCERHRHDAHGSENRVVAPRREARRREATEEEVVGGALGHGHGRCPPPPSTAGHPRRTPRRDALRTRRSARHPLAIAAAVHADEYGKSTSTATCAQSWPQVTQHPSSSPATPTRAPGKGTADRKAAPRGSRCAPSRAPDRTRGSRRPTSARCTARRRSGHSWSTLIEASSRSGTDRDPDARARTASAASASASSTTPRRGGPPKKSAVSATHART